MIELDTFWMMYFGLMSFFFGACMGSFLNVCIYRIPLEQSVVTPRSHCPQCNKLIPWHLNIPLWTYLQLGGRCKFCGVKISVRYFLVELLTAVLFLMVFFHYGLDPRTLVYWLMVFGLILGTFVDFEHMIIPDRVTLGGIAVGVPLSMLVPSLHHEVTWLGGLKLSLLGLAVGWGSLWMVGVIGKMVFKKDAMGFGDVKLMGALGALLGWQSILFIVMVSSMLGSVVGVALMLTKRKEWQSRIPFGPYIAMAAVIWILWGWRWWDTYVNYINGTTF